jgi:chemotaxis protein CheD
VGERKIIGISEMLVSGNPGEVLVTYSLGSCLGVTVYDPVANVAGMIHCMLPLSKIDKQKAEARKSMFVDTGIPYLFETMYKAGAKKENIVLKAAGCAQIMDPNGRFKIGERNFAVLRKLLWKNSVFIKGQAIGGNVSRTVRIDVETGKSIIVCNGEEVEL